MNYTLLTIGNKEYKLRLTTRGIVALEKSIGANPLQLFWDMDAGKLPKLTDMIILLHATLQSMEHGITLDDTYDIYDAFIADGHNMFDLVPIIINVFENAGFVNKNTETNSEEVKN